MELRQRPSGRRILLGAQIKRGGEGTVWAVEGDNGRVVKTYHRPSSDRARKLELMRKSATAELLEVAAWPIELVFKGDVGVGFVMLRVENGKGLHELYTIKSRRQSFPRADFRFIVHVATNLARLFGVIHDSGYVIGDVNESNILVRADGRCDLIDCDSIQVPDGNNFLACNVGVKNFTPPELQDSSFDGLVRTTDHDRFGLAVLLFHLLFLGRHPYAGRWSGADEMPVAKAIRENRFAFSNRKQDARFRAPNKSLPLAFCGPEIEALFEDAFDGTKERPTADNWIAALEKLKSKLVRCDKAGHYRVKDVAGCRWCDIAIDAFGPDPHRADAEVEIRQPIESGNQESPDKPAGARSVIIFVIIVLLVLATIVALSNQSQWRAEDRGIIPPSEVTISNSDTVIENTTSESEYSNAM